MMKISLVVNSEKYPYHRGLADLFSGAAKEYGSFEIFDMASREPMHEIYGRISASECDFLISFDCAGFEIRLTNDTLAYNKFGCRMAHILFQNREEYGENLRQQMNFSMFVFSAVKEDVLFIRKDFPNIPNIEWIEIPERYPFLGKDNQENGAWIPGWFSHIMKEAELL